MKRIMIVDDDIDILANLADILEDLGYETDTAASGEIAIEKMMRICPDASDCQYDLCLLDFKMPGMDGADLYERILKINPNLRAIMITAYAGDDGIERARKIGTWKVLRKPVDIEELLSMIRESTSLS